MLAWGCHGGITRAVAPILVGSALVGVGVGCCFARGTRVWTPRGPRPIERLRVGDEVWAWSTEHDAPFAREIVAVMRGEVDEVFRIEAGELVIDGVTATHPFWDPVGRSWRPAGELALGSLVLGWLGAADARVLAVTRAELRRERVEVFELTVEGEHTYFAEGLLVHNKSEKDTQDTASADLDEDGVSRGDGDCRDQDPTVYPEAPEICDDGVDNDCDGYVDTMDAACAARRVPASRGRR